MRTGSTLSEPTIEVNYEVVHATSILGGILMSHETRRYRSLLRSGLLVVALVSSSGLHAEKPLRPGEEVSVSFDSAIEDR